MRSIIHLDFESHSIADLRRVGAFKYAEHESTDVTCAAYLLPGDNEPRTWVPSRDGRAMPNDLRLAIATVGSEVHAWNAGFEHAIFDLLARRHGWAAPRPDQYFCSMALSSFWGLPAGLENAGEALELDETKLAGSRGLMLQMSKPRDFDPVDGKPIWWHRTDPAKLARLVRYCQQDVLSEHAAAAKLQPMPAVERATWLLDQAMNAKGVNVDLDLTRRLGEIAGDAVRSLRRDMITVTGGAVRSLSEVAKLMAWLRAQNIELESLQREELEELYPMMPAGPARNAVRIRLDGARTSTSKLQTLMDATCSDGTVKGLLRYFGAGRTGRWSGAGGAKVQPQNLPRPAYGLDVGSAIRCVQAGAGADDLDMVFAESPMTVASSCLRGCFVAPPGHLLVAADFSQIEARVLAALAGQQDILDVFASGQDVYTYDATALGSSNRQLGKTTRLGLGFQMGPDRFIVTAASYGIELDLAQARTIVSDWRAANGNIVGFWYELDTALREMVEDAPNSETTVGPIRLFKNRSGALLVYLPSGRPLVYRGLRFTPSEKRENSLDLVYRGVHPKTKQWADIKLYGGKLTENLVQATARDVMRDAMLEAAERGIDLRLTVHDELIAVAPEAEAPTVLETMLDIMRKAPAWLPTLPVTAGGYVADRYRKG